MDEAEGALLYVELSGPFDTADPPPLTIKVDADASGSYTPDEVYNFTSGEVTSFIDDPYLGFSFIDDGRSPGNGTSSDGVDAWAYFNGDTGRDGLTVYNVPPEFVSRVTVSRSRNDDGDLVLRASARVFDPGIRDDLVFTAQWADGVSTEATFSCNDAGTNCYSTRSVTLERTITNENAGFDDIPATFTIEDDDLGQDGADGSSYEIDELDVLVNSDDDNANDEPDFFEHPADFTDPDIIEYPIGDFITPAMDPDEGTFILSYSRGHLRVWDSPQKNHEYAPRDSEFSGNDSEFPDAIPYEGQGSIWVEGISPGESTIALAFLHDGHGADELPHVIHGGEVRVAAWGIDYDIDSDNNNGFDYPDNSDWEEYLEDSEYGIGKLIYPEASHFTPTRLRLPAGLDPNDPDIEVELDFDPVGESGIVHLWNTFKADPNKVNTAVEDGGNRLYPDRGYSLSDLGYNAATGGITIFVDAFDAFDGHSKKKGIDEKGKPDDRIKTIVTGLGVEDLEDEVKYMLADPNTFYPNLNASEPIRNAMASEGIYEVADLPQFALKLLDDEELADLGIPEDIRHLLGEPEDVPGFKSGLYFDHVSRMYVLAFAGSDDPEDVVANIWQGLGLPAEQYEAAMEIAYHLRENQHTAGRVLTTGHSLGGGLASAAAVVGRLPADTFNAAGLLRETLLARDVNGDVLAPEQERYPGALAAYDFLAPTLIDAYYLDFDILSAVQDSTPLQDAIGQRLEMDGPFDLEIGLLQATLAAELASGVGWAAVAANWAQVVYYMTLCHTTDYYHYGLLVDESTGWDIHGYELD